MMGSLKSLDICYWYQDDTDERVWYTSCVEKSMLEVATPSENGMAYCCYCDRILMEV